MRITILILAMSTLVNLNTRGQEPTNKHFWYSLETTAPASSIWSIWTVVPNWKKWDTGLKDALIEGPFEQDAKGFIISLENRKSKFKVVEYVEGKTYTFRTKLPLGSLYVKRYLALKDGKTTFTHEVWFTGLTKGLFAKAFGGKFREMLPEVLENIRAQAEKQLN